MVDSTDPIGPGAVLFTPEFYGNRRALAPGGVLVTQNGVPFLQSASELKQSASYFRDLFDDLRLSRHHAELFRRDTMSYGWATDDKDLRHHKLKKIERRYKKGEPLPDALLAPQHAARRLRTTPPTSASWSRLKGYGRSNAAGRPPTAGNNG